MWYNFIIIVHLEGSYMCTYQYVHRRKIRKTKEKNEKTRTRRFKEKEREPKKIEEEEYILKKKRNKRSHRKNYRL